MGHFGVKFEEFFAGDAGAELAVDFLYGFGEVRRLEEGAFHMFGVTLEALAGAGAGIDWGVAIADNLWKVNQAMCLKGFSTVMPK